MPSTSSKELVVPHDSRFGRPVVVTLVRGRLTHLVNQRRFLRAVAPGILHVVVGVDMPDLEDDLRAAGVWGDVVLASVDDDPRGMPTARARNAGVQAAREHGARRVVLLDVDCAPLPGFLAAFDGAAERLGESAVLNAVVTYLPPERRLEGCSPDEAMPWVDPHPARPAPPSGRVVVDESHRLLWSLAVGLELNVWDRIGGFDEAYVGYGAEDTDFGQRARTAGVSMAWVGGAHVVHQWHPSVMPPVHHLVDIVRNAGVYRERWGAWPMEGWPAQFAASGYVVWSDASLELTDAGRAAAAQARS